MISKEEYEKAEKIDKNVRYARWHINALLKSKDYAKDTTAYQLSTESRIKLTLNLLENEGIGKEKLKEMRFLDLGCGYGGLLLLLKPYFKHVEGVEYSKTLYYLYKILNLDVKVKRGNVAKLNLKEDFDIYYTFNITNNKKIFENILNNMKKDQIFIESFDWNDSIKNTGKEKGFEKVINYRGVTILIK